MFSGNDRYCFLTAVIFVTAGFALMVLDRAPQGFGILTLWIAPPLLLAGFFLPVVGIIGIENLRFQTGPCGGKHLGGLISFLAALFLYSITLEPTASLWDCSEFIASAYKLQVPHTPGTPLSLLIGRMFSMLSFGDDTKVAPLLNFMSALFSAGTVFLLYHIIYLLAVDFIKKNRSKNVILIVSSVGASLCLAFSDTFWFSAVEAETYGAACFFLMLLVWLILTGRNRNGPLRTRRLVLIFYVAGLAYCIHPMCLLALPILPFAWVTVGRRISFFNTGILFAGGLLIVLLINRTVAIGSFEVAFALDKFFVNTLSLPFYLGALGLVAVIALLTSIIAKRWRTLTPYVFSLVFLLAGFLPYLMLFIRSDHNPPIDEGNPENLSMIKAYMNRESYPSTPLLAGPYFDAKIVDVDVRKRVYFKDEKQYNLAGTLPGYVYDARQTFLPRMYSNDPDHIESYRQWSGMSAREKPDFYHNVRFMFAYQLGHMYFRYLMWNFAGRAGDEQNSGWLRPWQRLATGPFETGRNQYWMIPLVLGCVGAVFQCCRDSKGFMVVAMLFLIPGVILALYLNAPPNEPRERDYIYVGSFIAFCIWIGFGFLALGNLFSRFRRGVVAAFILCIAVPLWMLYQNFDDHNRAGRTFQVDNARNILSSCAPGSILFTGGDNDTFPLWYLQEVEGYRTDVRVMVLSYMNTDWYINQLRETYYDSGAFRLTLDKKDYRQYGANDVLYVHESISEGIDVSQFLALLKKGHPALTMSDRNGDPYHILPSRTLLVQAPGAPGTKTGAGEEDEHPQPMSLHVTGNYMSKNLLAILDIIVSNGWQRPVYFNFTSLNTLGMDLSSYVIQVGAVFRLSPVKNNTEQIPVDTDLTYRNIVENADYNNLLDPGVHFTYEDHFARMIVPVRQSFNDLARAFLQQGDQEMAMEVLKKAAEVLYAAHLPPSYTNLQAAEMLIAFGENGPAYSLSEAAFRYYYHRLGEMTEADKKPSDLDLYLVRRSAELLAETGDPDYLKMLGTRGDQ